MEDKKPEIKPVTKGSIKKRTLVDKMVDTFVAEDLRTVREHIFKEVVVPRIKNMIMDVTTNTINSVLYGSSARKPTNPMIGSTRINYSGVSSASRINYTGVQSPTVNFKPMARSFNEVTVKSFSDGNDILVAMREIIDRQGNVSINVLYEMAELPGESSYENYGWTNLKYAEVVPYGDEWLIKMPKPILIKDR